MRLEPPFLDSNIFNVQQCSLINVKKHEELTVNSGSEFLIGQCPLITRKIRHGHRVVVVTWFLLESFSDDIQHLQPPSFAAIEAIRDCLLNSHQLDLDSVPDKYTL